AGARSVTGPDLRGAPQDDLGGSGVEGLVRRCAHLVLGGRRGGQGVVHRVLPFVQERSGVEGRPGVFGCIRVRSGGGRVGRGAGAGPGQYVRRAGHQQVGDGVDVAPPPGFEGGALDQPVEGAHGGAAVDLVVGGVVLGAVEGGPGRRGEVPAEDEGHPAPRVVCGVVGDLRAPGVPVVPYDVLPHLGHRAAEAGAFEGGEGAGVDVLQAVVPPVEVVELVGAGGEHGAPADHLDAGADLEQVPGGGVGDVLHVEPGEQVLDRVGGAGLRAALV